MLVQLVAMTSSLFIFASATTQGPACTTPMPPYRASTARRIPLIDDSSIMLSRERSSSEQTSTCRTLPVCAPMVVRPQTNRGRRVVRTTKRMSNRRYLISAKQRHKCMARLLCTGRARALCLMFSRMCMKAPRIRDAVERFLSHITNTLMRLTLHLFGM